MLEFMRAAVVGFNETMDALDLVYGKRAPPPCVLPPPSWPIQSPRSWRKPAHRRVVSLGSSPDVCTGAAAASGLIDAAEQSCLVRPRSP